MKRFLSIFLLFFIFNAVKAQDFTDSWTGHFSYYNIQDLFLSEDKVYAAAENSIFIYNLNTNTTSKLSSINGLAGEPISEIYYSNEHNVLFVGYENGLIQVKPDHADEFFSVIEILEKPTIAPTDKKINHFYEVNGKLLISTGYGISEYNLTNFEFGDTYFIGPNGAQIEIAQLTVHNNNIYAATWGHGIRYANLNNPNLIDFDQWQAINPTSSWRGITQIGDAIYGIRSNNTLFQIEETGITNLAPIQSMVKDFWSNDNFMVASAADKVVVFDSEANQVGVLENLPNLGFNINTALYNGTQFFLGHETEGLIKTHLSNTNSIELLSPQGPLHNRIISIEATENELWTVFDEYSESFNPYPLSGKGASHLVNKEWHNFSSAYLMNAEELVNITINPNNPSEVYLSSYFSGLIKLIDEEPIINYNHTNGLDGLQANPLDVRINGTAFDNQGNLWITNARVEEALKVLTPEGNIQGVDVSPVISNPSADLGSTDLVVDNLNNVYYGTVNNGVIAYQSSTGDLAKVHGSDSNLPSNTIRSLAVDQNGALWIGTFSGLRVLYNPSSVFTQNTSTSAIIIMEGDTPQELLFEQLITDIEVDGSNNKWLSTASSGVFHISPNGQEILAHYTKDNSPLPSNNVTSVSIDHASGRIYFATINGLVSLQGSATQPQTNLEKVYAYPNPVRPGFSGDVVIDGLMRNANVKITDIEGNLVYEEVSQGGSILWDTTAFGKYKVASGVYMVLITSEDQTETKVTKIMVVR